MVCIRGNVHSVHNQEAQLSAVGIEEEALQKALLLQTVLSCFLLVQEVQTLAVQLL